MKRTSPALSDPILDEIRKFREEFSIRFHGDIKAMAEEMRRRAEASIRPGITLPPKRSTQVVKPRLVNTQIDTEQNCESVNH